MLSVVSGAVMPVRISVLWLIGLTCCVTLAYARVAARAEGRNAAVLVDSWWSADYASKACDQAKSFLDDDTMSRIRNFGCGAVVGCPGMMARLTACTSAGDPEAKASRFEDRLMTQFTTSPACKGAAFARYHGPDGQPPSAADEALMSRPHWEFSVDFVPG